jgi:L-lactate dehydrogenase
MEPKRRKVVVVGAGAVGTTYIYALLQTGLVNEVALIDIDRKRVEGEVMDLQHGLPFLPPVTVTMGEYSDTRDADLIVITAGAKQAPGQSRTELIQKNAEIIRSICGQIRRYESKAVIVMVANPVDTLTWVALDELGWPRRQIFGSGTVLDSSRFKFMLSEHCGVDPRNVHAYILGEHGDTELAAWSMTHLAGVPIREYCRICKVCDYPKHHLEIEEQVRNSAYHIIDYKGSTFYAIGLSLVRISEAVLRNERSVLTVSVRLEGEYGGLRDVCLSVPCIVGQDGIEKVIDAPITEEEQAKLRASAGAIRRVIEGLGQKV